MIFDSVILTAVSDELSRTLVGCKVERVSQPSPLEVVLSLYQRGAKLNLLLSADPQEARLHLTNQHRDNPLMPPPFCMLLRKHLGGNWVTEVHQPWGFPERIIFIELQSHDGTRSTLAAETMGKHSNIILLNAAGIVLGSVKTISHEINRFREIKPGVAYIPPPRQMDKKDPFQHFDPALVPSPPAGQEAEWYTKTFSGVSPLLAQEALLHAHPPWTSESLWYGLNEILLKVRLGDYDPRIWGDESGHVLGAYPLPLLSVPKNQQREIKSISEALDEAAATGTRQTSFQQAHDVLQAALHRTRKARLRERESTAQGLQNSARADEYQQAGELILTHPDLIVRGAAEVVLPDYYAPVTELGNPPLRSLALDPMLDFHENAERYFKKARKARDSKTFLQQRLTSLDAEVLLLEKAEQGARAASTVEEVAVIREQIAAALIPSQKVRTGEPSVQREPTFEGHKIKMFRSPDGWEILVGENASSNDYLTTRVASPSDIWLHVRAGASAHGVIRTGNRPAAVSTAAIQQAAELVAARSEVKHSSLISVDYTLKKYVRKPRKSAPGAVTYQNEKTITVSGISS